MSAQSPGWAVVLAMDGHAPVSPEYARLIVHMCVGEWPNECTSDDAEAGMWTVSLPKSAVKRCIKEGGLELKVTLGDHEYTLDMDPGECEEDDPAPSGGAQP